MDHLGLFAWLWALGRLIQVFVYYPHLMALGSHVLVILIVVASALTLVFPACLAGFIFLCIFRIACTFLLSPLTANHVVFEAFIEFAFLVILVPQFFGKGVRHRERKEIHTDFSNVVRISLAALYAMSALHKTNWAYLDPTVSCATRMFSDIFPSTPGFLKNPLTDQISILGSLGFEWVMAFLLLFRRWVKPAILLALPVHFIWGLHGFVGVNDFSILLYSLYFLLAPAEWVEHILGVLRRFSRAFFRVSIAIAIGLSGILLVQYFLLDPPSHWVLDQSLFFRIKVFRSFTDIVWKSFGLVTLILFFYLAKTSSTGSCEIRRAKKWMAIIPASILLLGLSPYLGFKTVPVFSMFSNLQTYSPHWNHLFIPKSAKWTAMEEDIIEVFETNHPVVGLITGLGKGETRIKKTAWIPLRGLISWMSLAPGEVKYRGRLGEERLLRAGNNGLFRDQSEFLRVSVWDRILFAFKPVELTDRPRCGW